MGILDKLFRRAQSSVDEIADKAQEVASEHGDQISGGVHKAADFVDDKTGGKFADKIDKIEEAADDLVEKHDQTPDAPEGATPPTDAPRA